MTILIVCGSGAEERNECSTALCEQVALAKEVSERPGLRSVDCTELVLRKESDRHRRGLARALHQVESANMGKVLSELIESAAIRPKWGWTAPTRIRRLVARMLEKRRGPGGPRSAKTSSRGAASLPMAGKGQTRGGLPIGKSRKRFCHESVTNSLFWFRLPLREIAFSKT